MQTTASAPSISHSHTASAVADLPWWHDFADPPAVFRPVPFWSWNEEMEPGEVRRQAQLIHDAGWGGGFIHSRVGLTTPYLGEEWFSAARAAVEACRELGMKVWLYDEDKWPSGYSGGTVPLAEESFRMKALYARPEGVDPLPGSRLIHQGGGVCVYRWVSPLGYAWFNGTCYADLMDRAAMRRFLDDAYETYFERFGADYGGLIGAEFTDEPCSMFRGRVPPGAVPWTDAIPGRFHAMHDYDPAPHMHLLFDTDADSTRGNGPSPEQFRLHYYRAANELFEQNFSRQLGDWCREHRIELTGHYMLEGSIYGQQLWGVKIMPNYRHQGIPGIDHLGRKIDEILTAKQCQSVVNQYAKPRMLSELYGVAGDSLSFSDRRWIAHQQLALGVNLLNPHLALYTMAGCRKRDYPQNMYYQQPWWPLNRVCDEPLSRLCVALSQGQYVAELLVIHPQESTFTSWRGLVPGADEQADRLRGNDVQGDGFAEWDWEPVPAEVRKELEDLDAQFDAVLRALLGAQRTFDLGDETILAQDARVEQRDGQPVLVVGEMGYRAVVVPAMRTMARATLDLLKNFAEAGGTILQCGTPPPLVEGIADTSAADFLKAQLSPEPDALPAAVAKVFPPEIRVDGITFEQAQLLYAHLRDIPEGQRVVYLTNLHRDQQFTARCTFAGDWRTVRLLDPRDGTIHRLAAEVLDEGVQVTLPFAPTQAHLLLLSIATSPGEDSQTLTHPQPRASQDLEAISWRVERLDDNALPLDTACWAEGDAALSRCAIPVVAIQERLNRIRYDGPLTLCYGFHADATAVGRPVRLVVEHPERYRIRVNGTEVRYEGLPFWRDIRWLPIDITPHVQAGENVVELLCADFRFGDRTRHDDPPGRYGTEIEAIYLVGDFAVPGQTTDEQPMSPQWAQWGQQAPAQRCLEPKSIRLAAPGTLAAGDVTDQGLAFYAGRLRLTADLEVDPALGRPFLRADRLQGAVAEVAVNGQAIGYLAEEPFELAVGERTGLVTLSLTLYSTLRNLLGPLHHPDGDLPAVDPSSFLPVWPEPTEMPQRVLEWGDGTVQPERWRDSYNVIAFGGVPGLRIDYV